MKTLNSYCREIFGEKVYKLSLSCAVTCPNRDGTKGTSGCIFCSGAGSGDFAESALLPVGEQIERAKTRVSAKFTGNKYIAYFQAFTSTYAPLEYLERVFTEAIERDDIAALSIATRPDCLDEGIYNPIRECFLDKFFRHLMRIKILKTFLLFLWYLSKKE